MRQENRASALNFSLVFFGGAILGAGTALLLAPRSGEETRESLGQMANQAGEMVGGLVDWGKDLVRRGEDQVETAASQAGFNEPGQQGA